MEYVLTTFKGLFRRSINKSSTGEYYYTLQLRFAKRWMEDKNDESDEAEVKEPLSANYLQALFTLISARATQEVELRKTRVQGIFTLVGAWVAAIAAIFAAFISVHKSTAPAVERETFAKAAIHAVNFPLTATL